VDNTNGMSERDETLAFLGLRAGASLLEIEDAFSRRYRSAGDRLAAGDESARVELAVLRRAYEELVGRSPGPPEVGAPPSRSGPVGLIGDAAIEIERPHWGAAYLAFVFAAGSVALLTELAVRLPHIYHEGGFLIPLALIVSSLVCSVLATILAENELRYGKRARLLRRKGLEAPEGWVSMRFYAAYLASVFSRATRWLAVPALFATVFLNFASLSGRWSLRH
jgi:hypothetical protein